MILQEDIVKTIFNNTIGKSLLEYTDSKIYTQEIKQFFELLLNNSNLFASVLSNRIDNSSKKFKKSL